MKIFKKLTTLFLILSLSIVLNNMAVNAEEVGDKSNTQPFYSQVYKDGSIVEFYGAIKTKDDIYYESDNLSQSDFIVDGYLSVTKNGNITRYENLRFTNGMDINGVFHLELWDSGNVFYIPFTINKVPFNPILHCEYNKNEVIKVESMYKTVKNEYLGNTTTVKAFSLDDVKFYNSIGREINASLQTSNYTYQYGYNNVKYVASATGYNDLKGEITFEILPTAKATTVKSNAIALTQNNTLEYKNGKDGKWQSARTFKNLKQNTQYTFYVRTKATDKFKAGTEVAIKVKTLKE